MESNLLANSFWLEFKNFKIVKEETKYERENTDVNKETIDLNWIVIWLIFLSRWVWLSSYSLDDSLFRNTLFMFGRNALNTKKMKIVNKPVDEVRFLRTTSCEADRKSKNGAE